MKLLADLFPVLLFFVAYQLYDIYVATLVAIVAAISLTLRRRPETRYQDPASQVVVKKKDRLKIVKMEAEE